MIFEYYETDTGYILYSVPVFPPLGLTVPESIASVFSDEEGYCKLPLKGRKLKVVENDTEYSLIIPFNSANPLYQQLLQELTNEKYTNISILGEIISSRYLLQ